MQYDNGTNGLYKPTIPEVNKMNDLWILQHKVLAPQVVNSVCQELVDKYGNKRDLLQ